MSSVGEIGGAQHNMDYVTWCHQVLDTIVEMTGEFEEFRFGGFKMLDVAVKLFGPSAATHPDSADSERYQAVSQALYTLAGLTLIGIPDPIGNVSDPTWVLGDRGKGGSERLRREWGVSHFGPTEEDALQILRALVPLSEQTRSDLAFRIFVPYSSLQSALGWSDLKFSAYFSTDGLGWRGVGNRWHSYVDQGVTNTAHRERGARVTYAGLVIYHYGDEWIRLRQEARVRESRRHLQVPDRSLDLTFMTDLALRASLEQDYQEALLSSTAEAYKAASILLVGILEGMLLDAFQQPPLASDPQLTAALTRMNKKFPMSGNFDWGKVSLSGFTDLAEGCNLLDVPRSKLVRGATDFRDNVHPAAQVRSNVRPTSNDVALLMTVLDVIAERVAARLGAP